MKKSEFQAPVSVRGTQSCHVGRYWIWRMKRNRAMWLGGPWGNRVVVDSVVRDVRSKYFRISVRRCEPWWRGKG